MDNAYNLFDVSPGAGLRYTFTSTGINDIIKVIDYSFVDFQSDVIKADAIFNFGFGDYDFETGTIKDDIMSDNGDGRMVLRTSLSTIPFFFEKYPTHAIMITGSDSKDDYHEKCFPDCRKRCKHPKDCRNKHQRINVYRRHLDNNFEEYSKSYNFFGGIGDIIEEYVPEKMYYSVFVIKK